jgi:hypothetical protein
MPQTLWSAVLGPVVYTFFNKDVPIASFTGVLSIREVSPDAPVDFPSIADPAAA